MPQSIENFRDLLICGKRLEDLLGQEVLGLELLDLLDEFLLGMLDMDLIHALGDF
jgi:hypothetical protein